MADAPRSLAEQEYRALRATIRERGTARPIVMGLTIVSWAIASIWLLGSGATPVALLVSLVILDAGFEAVFSMHVGVERIGRYLQVRYETPDGPHWEHAAMETPPAAASKPANALFSTVFLLATGLNLALTCWLTVARSPTLVSADVGSAASVFTWTDVPVVLLGLAVVAHALFAARIFGARKFAAGQRARDLAFFRSLGS